MSEGCMLGLEGGSEALDLLEVKGFESPALKLMEAASAADPFSPNAFTFHLNFLYTHGFDARAAVRLRRYEAAVPASNVLPQMRPVVANQSAPMLRQRGQTINGQIARMREGAPTAIGQATRADAQHAAVEAVRSSSYTGKYMLLGVEENNTAAVQLYEKCGFVTQSGPGCQIRLMRKQL